MKLTTHQIPEDTSSTASFEDVTAIRAADRASPFIKDLLALAPKSKVFQDGEVPPILYVVQYRDVGGRLVDTRQSDRPIDVSTESIEIDPDSNEKPVLEIRTKVSAYVKRPTRGPRPVHNMDYYSEDSCSDSEDEQDELNIAKEEKTEMIIHSAHLKHALNAVVAYYPGVEFADGRIEAPYKILIHHRQALAAYAYNQPVSHSQAYKETTTEHINVLLAFLEEMFGEKIRQEEQLHKNHTPTATFQWLWYILKPGEVVYHKDHDEWVPFVISSVSPVLVGNDRRLESFSVACWNIEFQSNKLRREMKSFSVRNFPGERAIQTLPIVPAAFFPEDLEQQGGLTMKEKQVQLGKLYWELVQKPAYKEYDGQLVDQDGGATGHFKGRLIVDAEGYERFNFNGPDRFRERRPGRPPPLPGHGLITNPPKDYLPLSKPRCSCMACSREDREEKSPLANFEDLDPLKSEPPKNDLYYLVCSNEIPAFLLSERRWSYISIALLQDVKPDREAFKYLVLDDDIKLTVKALIGKFASADGKVSPWPRDIVKNKGEGRIFLLHGSPGVGKTCTAECVAELTHRPLLSLTSGDISTNMSAKSVEGNLNYFLQLGERYGALVLLDEADVYLEQRRTKDLHRNGLVSIFLRALEYYRGVLFLTTNRVEAFDSAFTSRIHVALHYRRLSDADRLRIWNNNIERLERDSAGRVFVSRSARDFAVDSADVQALRWNGREIRNGLQTAVALAESEALEDGAERVLVTDAHLNAVVKMSKGFKDFLRRRRREYGTESDVDDEEDDEDDGISSSFEDD
ncbi:uncharacterized protein E0L32_003311 [Thyridium curvatum]|uniref:AAA+ ATPase domain-containing protein n=1 Tax=Thyridium curvatum TaxID=1093900 RepID=A0A507BCE5_9PEZI|nr:uncharacterized protein E0L32_003311 [Thyridium curvatum]TPX17193.1 hypothetical protein E0L32_003311 [Thyridium curvatum]